MGANDGKLGLADLYKIYPLTMLLVDDDESYFESLFRDAQRHHIFLKHVKTGEELMQVLEGSEGQAVSGIMMDVVCNISKSQNTPKNNFIQWALDHLTKGNHQIPTVVLTAEPEEFKKYKEIYDGTRTVFSKSASPNDMFQMLREEAMKMEDNKIFIKYSEIFNIVERRLGKDGKAELLGLLKNMDKDEPHAVKGNLSCCRTLLEKMIYALHDVDNQMIPKEYVFDPSGRRHVIDFSGIQHHLRGRYDNNTTKKNQGTEYIKFQSTIDRFIELVYRVSSEGIHAIKENASIKPNKYAVQAIAFALLDVVLWFEKNFEAANQ